MEGKCTARLVGLRGLIRRWLVAEIGGLAAPSDFLTDDCDCSTRSHDENPIAGKDGCSFALAVDPTCWMRALPTKNWPIGLTPRSLSSSIVSGMHITSTSGKTSGPSTPPPPDRNIDQEYGENVRFFDEDLDNISPMMVNPSPRAHEQQSQPTTTCM